MRSPGIVQRHPELWWLVSIAAVVTVGITLGTSVSGVFRNDSSLPATSPDALVDNVLHRSSDGYSGTVTGQVQLGLPRPMRWAVAAAVPAAGAILDGTAHTVQYWYGGADKQRVALRTRGGEQDVFRNGSQVLSWNTATSVARTATARTGTAGLRLSAATPLAMMPPALADTLLTEAGDDSDTSLRSGDTTAGRQTYELVLRPRADQSRVAEVDIQVDGTSYVPLGVQIFARDSNAPAVSVMFTSIRYVAPAGRNFTFTPPSSELAQVPDSADTAVPPQPLAAVLGRAQVHGTGWAAVSTVSATATQATLVREYFGTDLAAVTGRWGKGKQACTPLLCVLITSKDAVLFGAVQPAALYDAVG